MTTTPSASAAPIHPVSPAAGQSLDLSPQPKAPTPAEMTADVVWTGKLEVSNPEYPDHAKHFTLVPDLTGYDMSVLQEAQDSGKFKAVIEATGQLVEAGERDDLIAVLMNPAPAPHERISLERAMEILGNGMEQIAARPRPK